MPFLKFQKTDASIPNPKFAYEGDACFDLAAAEHTYIQPGSTSAIGTGLKFVIPRGYELQIRARSGLSLNTKLRIANSIGTVDQNYRAEVKVIVDNIGTEVIEIKAGQRIAQAALREVPTVILIPEFGNIEPTSRNEKGFGSSGK